MMHSFALMVVCLWAIQQGCCWARSKHGKLQDDSTFNQGLTGSAAQVEDTYAVDDGSCWDKNVLFCLQLNNNLMQLCELPIYRMNCQKTCGYCDTTTKGCRVKTVDGVCCSFPFLYKEIKQDTCIGTARKWCGTTYNYDQDKKWGWCTNEGVKCTGVKTMDGVCCKFPFLYKGIKQNTCTGTAKKWCGTTHNYDQDKKWGWCEEGHCSVKTVDGVCCSFPFLYKGNEQTNCIGAARKWCGTTSNYDQDKQWGWCEGCTQKTEGGKCCVFPFLYKGEQQNNCVGQTARKWCGTTNNYDQDKEWGWCN